MDSDSPDWSLYRSFLSVLRTGSLSAAARDDGLTQPTAIEPAGDTLWVGDRAKDKAIAIPMPK